MGRRLESFVACRGGGNFRIFVMGWHGGLSAQLSFSHFTTTQLYEADGDDERAQSYAASDMFTVKHLIRSCFRVG